MKKGFLITLVLAVSLSITIVFADYVDADARLYVLNGTNVTIRGHIRADNSSGLNVTNVTGFLGSSNFSVFTNTSRNWTIGYFEFNLTTSNTTGRYNVTANATLSNGTVVTENIEIRVGNLGNATFNFTNRRPPFTNGSYFELNVSFSGTTSAPPKLEIFSPNGANSSGWTINNITSRLNTNSIIYNITVPVTADGRYVLMFDEGAGSVTFLVKSTVVAVAGAQDSSNSSATSYGSGEHIMVIGKVRDENNAITNANVTAFITMPNGTVTSLGLVHNRTGTDGTYAAEFNATDLIGDYKIEIVADASGKIIRSTTTTTVQALEGRLDIVKEFFFDFGSSSAFQRSGNVEFNVLVYNLTNDILLNGSTTTNLGADVNCTAIRATELKSMLNGSLLTLPTLTKTTNLFAGQTVCKLRFTAPDADGIYSFTVNASVGANQTNNMTVLITGYFAVQSYILKPNPVSSFGSGHEFMSFLMPGDNATFEMAARSLSSNGAAVPGVNITSFNVTKILPMDFTGSGQTEITNFTGLTGAFTAGTATSNPKVVIKIPENRTGPFQIEFQANVNGSVIRGTSFYFARYVEGFAFPGSFGGGFGTGGGEGEHGTGGEGGGGPGGGGAGFGGDSGGSFKCSGQQNFSAKAFDVRTRQAAKNVVFNSIQEARDELTGRSVKSQLSIASSSTTDSSGFGNITISFSGSFSGFYFMLINITTADGKSDSLPAGFECRQLSFFPQITAIGSTGGGGFFVAPAAGLNITVSGIRNLNNGKSVQNGTVRIAKLESFDPAKGHKGLAGPATQFALLNGSAAFTLFPSNFSGLGGKWSNGFNNMRIQVCDNSTATATCDTSFGGFMVVAFDAFLDFSASPPSSVSANTSVVFRIMARTNVTNFTAQIGLPWEGSLQDVTVNSSTKISDGWNSPNDNTNFSGFERWDVNLSLPASLRKGFNMVTIKVNNYLSESTDVMTFVSASKLALSVPDTEGIFMTNISVAGNASNATQVTAFVLQYRVNLTNLSSMYNVNSKSGSVCARINFTTSRFGMFTQSVTYSSLANTSVFLLDNSTPGTYDTLVVSINNGSQIAVARSGNRSLASAGLGGLYFIEAKDCGFASIVNTTLNGTGFGSGFGGQHAVGAVATIPIIVKQSGKGKGSVFVDVSQLLVQQDFGGGRGGFGFVEILPASNFTRTGGTTDANGIAFLNLRVNRSGSYSILWNLSDAGDTDTADFSQGIPIEIKTFVTSGGTVTGNHPLPYRIVNLTRTNETGLNNATILGTDFFLGTWNEATLGTFIDDFTTHNHTIALRNVTHIAPGLTYTFIPDFSEVVIDNDALLCTNCTGAEGDSFSPVRFNWTDRSQPISSDTLSVDGNRTVNANITQVLFANPNTFFSTFLSNPGSSTRVNANITVRACAQTFSKPQTPLIGVNITNITTQSFSFSGPPTAERLDMFEPFTGANVTSVLTGPSGCATFNVTRSGGWKSGSPNEIKAKITSGSNTEELFVGSVFVACPSAGLCF